MEKGRVRSQSRSVRPGVEIQPKGLAQGEPEAIAPVHLLMPIHSLLPTPSQDLKSLCFSLRGFQKLTLGSLISPHSP